MTDYPYIDKNGHGSIRSVVLSHYFAAIMSVYTFAIPMHPITVIKTPPADRRICD
jgi:hypothetical protein